MDLQTAYGVLGVRPGAREHEVRDAHQRLSATWQPARFQQDPTQRQHAEAMFAQIQQALDSIARAGFPSAPPHAFAPPSNAPSAPNPFAANLEAQRATKRSRAFVQIGLGLLLLIVGAAITASTHESAAQRGGGTYIIAYGPIIFGVVSFFRGLFGLLSA